LDYEVIWCATNMPGDAQSIQLSVRFIPLG